MGKQNPPLRVLEADLTWFLGLLFLDIGFLGISFLGIGFLGVDESC